MIATTRELVNTGYGLRELMNNDTIVLPAKVSFVIMRNFRNLVPIVEDYEEARRQLIIKYGVPTGDNKYTVDEDKVPLFNKELDSILDTTVEVNITTVDVKDLDGFNLPVKYMDCLFSMISE